MLLHPSLRQPINLEQQQLFNFLMRVWLLDLLCPTATKGWNGNLQIVCFYGTFFNVVVPAQWPQQMQFSLACNTVYTPPSKARTHRTQSSYPNNLPYITNFFYSFNVSWKEFHQDLNHSYTNLPSPKKYYGLEQNFGQRRTSSSSSQASQGATPIITKWQDFLTITILAQSRDQRYKFFLLYCRAIAEDDLKTCFFNMQNIPL